MPRRSPTPSAPSWAEIPLGDPLLTREEMRAADHFGIASLAIPSLTLMEQAALGACERLSQRFGGSLTKTRGLIVAGTGNNGGDALAVARILHSRGVRSLHVSVVGDSKKSTPETRAQTKSLSALGVALSPLPRSIRDFEWIIDGIFGTGLSREVTGDAAKAIAVLREATPRPWVLSLDIPSGLCADTGRSLGIAVSAAETVSFGFWKRGLVTGEGPGHTGALTLVPLSIPLDSPDMGLSPSAFRFGPAQARSVLPKRRPASHKGDFGHVYLWVGEPEKEGAAGLAALSALRIGSGLATLCGPRDLSGLRARLPAEVMTAENRPMDWIPEKKGSVLVLGPGLGTSREALARTESAIASALPLVLDADALNILSATTALKQKIAARKAPTVATPHPAEAARLLGCDTPSVEADRFAAVHRLADGLGCCVLLKGKGTLISWPKGPALVVSRGSSALAKGGSGDLLSGLIGSLLAQGTSAQAAACLGAYIHGAAGEWVAQAQGTERSALASEVAAALPSVIGELES